MVKKIILVLILVTTFLNADVFEKGRFGVGATLGAGTDFGETYTIAGVNASYFVIDNLNVGVAYRGWFGASPSKNELTLSSTYFIPLSEKFHPYAGIFARQIFVNEYDDYQSYGANAGVAISMSKNSYLGIGYVYEEYSKCVLQQKCSTSYPEVMFALSF